MVKKINTILLVCILVIALVCAGLLCYNTFKGNETDSSTKNDTYATLLSCYEQVRAKTDFVPEIALVLGSGLGDFADNIEVLGEIDYHDIKGFPVSTAPGHDGKFIYGTLGGKNIICMKGRIHYYEGYSADEVVLPIRLMKLMGAEKIILTNAAGGLNADFSVGDLMLITNHISLFAVNPLIGPNFLELGERFTDMSVPYDEDLNKILRKSAENIGTTLQEGVYVQVTGPSYESVSETGLLRTLGADAVGMSTVMECIAARHAGMKVCALSCITNLAYDISSSNPSEQEVIEAGKQSSEKFSKLLINAIKSM